MVNEIQANREKTLIFIHIPRTGGVTLDTILERHYNLARMFSLYNEQQVEEFRQLSDERKQKIEFLNGHFMSCGIHEKLPNSCNYITLLRNPLERVVSEYYFIKRSPHVYLHERVTSENMSLKDFVSSEMTIETNNGQTRLIAGLKTSPGIGIGKCPPEMLKLAKNNIDRHFAVLGFTEEFDKTLILLKRALGLRETFYVKRNQTKNRKAVDDLPQETLKLIEKYNELDLELYNYAKVRFEEKIKSLGDSFEKELREFKALNERFGSIYTWTGLAINKVKKMFLIK